MVLNRPAPKRPGYLKIDLQSFRSESALYLNDTLHRRSDKSLLDLCLTHILQLTNWKFDINEEDCKKRKTRRLMWWDCQLLTEDFLHQCRKLWHLILKTLERTILPWQKTHLCILCYRWSTLSPKERSCAQAAALHKKSAKDMCVVLRAAVQFSHICVSYRAGDVRGVNSVAELFLEIASANIFETGYRLNVSTSG